MAFRMFFYKNELRLNWVNYLDKLERNQQYERNMSSVYYKVDTKSTSYCNCRQDDVKSLGGAAKVVRTQQSVLQYGDSCE